MAERRDQEPWERSSPRKTAQKAKRPRKLTPAQKAEARGRARKAGRKYPNLVDNMAVARKKKSSGGTKKKSAKKRTAKKRTAKKRAAKKRATKKAAR